MQLLQKILSDSGLPAPDGRPLHDYSCSPETFAELGEALQSRGAAGRGIETAAAAFVFWAAEHIRARFPGGPLTWVFVFNGLGLPDNQQLGRELAEQGLGWWGREIRVSDAGTRMSLYSLMAEGGIPETLLKEPGLYRGVVMGLLSEIEVEGGPAAGPWAEQIASRWTLRLPQTFQNADIARLLGTLALSLAKLRAMLPDDLPEAAAEQWLNTHRPGWTSDIPLRMTPEIAETLIRPALRAERDSHSVAARPLCGRELCHVRRHQRRAECHRLTGLRSHLRDPHRYRTQSRLNLARRQIAVAHHACALPSDRRRCECSANSSCNSACTAW